MGSCLRPTYIELVVKEDRAFSDHYNERVEGIIKQHEAGGSVICWWLRPSTGRVTVLQLQFVCLNKADEVKNTESIINHNIFALREWGLSLSILTILTNHVATMYQSENGKLQQHDIDVAKYN